MTDKKQEEIMKRMLAGAARMREQGLRLKYLLQVADTAEHVLKAHDLQLELMKANGSGEAAIHIAQCVAAPFKSHLELLKSALELYWEVAETPVEEPEGPPDEVA